MVFLFGTNHFQIFVLLDMLDRLMLPTFLCTLSSHQYILCKTGVHNLTLEDCTEFHNIQHIQVALDNLNHLMIFLNRALQVMAIYPSLIK